MADLLDASVPSNSDAIKNGAGAIRDMKGTLNTALANFVDSNGAPLANSIATAQIQDNAVTTAKIPDSAITTAKINDAAVTKAKLADAALHGDDTDITSGSLVSGVTYRIRTYHAGDDFSNLGGPSPSTAADGQSFTATGSGAPTDYSHGSVLSPDDAVGLAKMQDKFVKTEKLEDRAVTTDKIADASVTEAKLADGSVTAAKLGTDIPSIAMVRWSGAGYIHDALHASPNVSGNDITLNAVLPGGFPIAGAGVTSDNAPCGIIVQNTTTSGSATGATNVTLGQLYYIYAVSTTVIRLATSVQGAIDGTTDIVTPTSNFTGTSPVLKAFNPANVFKKGCDLIPISSNSSVNQIKGFRVIWRTAWSAALAGSVQIAQEAEDTIQSLRQFGTPSAASADLWYYDASSTPALRGEQTTSGMQGLTSYNSIVGFRF